MRQRRPVVNRLRVLRAERRLTQLDLALSSGIGVTRYWKIENAYAVPTTDELRVLSQALGVAPEAILAPAAPPAVPQPSSTESVPLTDGA